jgi:thioester reductase-like protein
MAIFLTGSTGYIGAQLVSRLLESHSEALNLLVRAKRQHEAEERLWRALQLNLDFARFHHFLKTRVSLFLGDLTDSRFGLGAAEYTRLVKTTDSVLHCAASLNRKSEKACLNVNLRGTLEVVQLASRSRDDHGLRRFSQVSTVAVAGHRKNEVVEEDRAIEWDRSDYDPYARTKKFAEHMVRELLPDVPRTVFRPSIVLGDSQRGETTQFDMVRTFVLLAGLPVLPFRPTDRVDIVPVDFVADSIVALHQKEKTNHEIYHLSAGTGSQTFRELTDNLSAIQKKPKPLYLPSLEGPFTALSNLMASRRGSIGHIGSLFKVFLPYLVWNTVFDNGRVVGELGRVPAPFSQYSYPLLKFSKEHHFTFPFQEWPESAGGSAR